MLRPDTFALTALLALLTALGPLAVDMYLPSFPEIGQVLGASPATVQLTLSLYLIAYAAGQVIYGPLSDRFGRIPVMRFALIVYCVASTACAAAPNIELLLTSRAVQALDKRAHNVLRILRLAPRHHSEDACLHREIQYGDSRDRDQNRARDVALRIANLRAQIADVVVAEVGVNRIH